MKKFNEEIVKYLQEERIGVLAVEMLDGSPHAATVHFSYDEKENIFYFETYREYRKTEPILNKEKVRASFVVGVNENKMMTLQMDGLVDLLNEKTLPGFEENYFAKFPNKLEKYKAGNFVCFSLKPTWWRFTDWTAANGKIILNSEN